MSTIIAKKIKRIFHISDFSLFRKNLKKKFGQLVHYKKYTAKDVVSVMEKMGMQKGSIVCIHSSMKEFYNYKGTAEELISEILSVIGPEGTLMMPAYPCYSLLTDDYIFNAKTDKTGAGYLAETFRKYPGVKRSINILHSVCAIGPMSDYLLNEHHLGLDCWDKKSPWYKLCERNGLVFNLGMPRYFIGTFSHCVESLLQTEHPYWAQLFTKEKKFLYYDENGSVKSYINFTSEIPRTNSTKGIFKWFSSKDWKIEKISNLEIKVFYSNHCLEKMLNLGRIGVSRYSSPSTKKYDF